MLANLRRDNKLLREEKLAGLKIAERDVEWALKEEAENFYLKSKSLQSKTEDSEFYREKNIIVCKKREEVLNRLK